MFIIEQLEEQKQGIEELIRKQVDSFTQMSPEMIQSMSLIQLRLNHQHAIQSIRSQIQALKDSNLKKNQEK